MKKKIHSKRELQDVFTLNGSKSTKYKSIKASFIKSTGFSTLSTLCFYSEYLKIIKDTKSYRLVFAFDPKNPERTMPLEYTHDGDVFRLPFISYKVNLRTKELVEAYYLRMLFPYGTTIFDLENDTEYTGKVFKKEDKYYGKIKEITNDEYYGSNGVLIPFPFDDIMEMIAGKRKPYVARYKGEDNSIFLFSSNMWIELTDIEEDLILPIRNDFDIMCNMFSIGNND